MINLNLFLRSLRLWHRRISLFLLIWIFFVALTGIALNHSEDFGFDSKRLPGAILKTVYHVDPPEVESHYIDGHWVSLVGNQQLYLDKHAVGYCKHLNGVSTYDKELYIGCVDSVYLVTVQGEIIEQLSSRFGLPVPISAFGTCDSAPCLISNNTSYILNPGRFSWEPTNEGFHPSTVSVSPEGLKSFLQQENAPQDFHLERLIRDLHSGLFFGLGPWLMDIFALLLMVLSITGFAIWWISRQK